MTRSIQEIFNAVIEAGHYTKKNSDSSDNWMCCALRLAAISGTITTEERVVAKHEIRHYLDTSSSKVIILSNALLMSNLPNSFADRLAIYRDWKNKPVLK